MDTNFSRDWVADRLRLFAYAECPNLPVYRRVLLGAADDGEMLDLYRDTPVGQRRANLLLAAAHDLLLRGVEHPLAEWYPSVNGGVAPADGDPFPAFRDLVLSHRDDVAHMLATRSTQTNEVNRSCLWFLAARHAASSLPGRPLAIIEVGASAGLNLLFDRWAIDFGDGRVRGEGSSPVRLACEVVGGLPPIDDPAPELASRLGLDLEPVDVFDADAVRWLQACIWPEQPVRHERFLSAIDIARQGPVEVVAGDAVDALPGLIARAPEGAHVVVINSWVLTYLARPRRAEFAGVLAETGASRDLTWYSAEFAGVDGQFEANEDDLQTIVGTRTWRDGEVRTSTVASVHPHLQQVRWRG